MSEITSTDLAQVQANLREIRVAVTWAHEHANTLGTLPPAEERRRAGRLQGIAEEMHEIEGLVAQVLDLVEGRQQ